MARIRYIKKSELQDDDKDILARDLNLYKALAHSVAGARSFAAPAMYLRHGSQLDPRLRELAILQVGYATKSLYEYTHHIEIALGVDVTRDDILAIAADSAGEKTHLGEIERAVLALARELVAGTTVRDETFKLLTAELDERDIVDLVIAVSFYCGVVRLLGALEIDLEPPYDKYLEEFPIE